MSDTSSSLSDLKNVLKETLEARGSLGQIKARIRAEIFAALDDESVPKPRLSNENLIINELIREYLAYNGYRHAHSVFLAASANGYSHVILRLTESGQPQEPAFHRDFLAKELQVEDDPRFAHVPLMYGIVASLQRARASEEGNNDFPPNQSIPAESARAIHARASPPLGDRQRFTTHAARHASEPSPLLFQK